ncbi:MAG: DNA mismatch repair protein MutS [Firmicutes bacterium]|nr:DNA mismatch repair protein MutS [Bacillota bacterium]
MSKEKLSPMMRQYLDVKENHQDCILFFRLGDFYEMFFDDAKLASRELELTLTGKNCGLEERAPMCGVPFHSADTYIARLVEKGYKVAICEQTSDPASSKGLVSRDVVQIVTPGTVISSTMLDERENNYIASIYADEGSIGFAYCDISTGEARMTCVEGPDRIETIVNEIVKINASEIVLDQNMADLLDVEGLKPIVDAYFNVLDDTFYRLESSEETIKKQFHVSALYGIGLDDRPSTEYALGALLLYLLDMQKNDLEHIRSISYYSVGQHMSLDKATIRNLELTETLYEKKLQGSLLGVLDKTHTAMGSRRMKQWLKEPLNNVGMIRRRLDAVGDLAGDIIHRNDIKECLKRVYDFERLTGRIATGKANGRDMIALRNSCHVLPDIKYALQDLVGSGDGDDLLAELYDNIYDLSEVYELIDRGIVEEPPFTVKEGGLIKEGYSEQLDSLKASIFDAQNWIASLEASERERTGIKNLKVGFNKVFGYYLEVTRSYYDMIPEDYIRKQTLVGSERFVTPQLKETERLVLNAETEINKLEYELFTEIRQKLQESIDRIQTTSRAISVLDVLTAFATVAEQNDYVKPEVDDTDVIMIERGRHPVIEKTIRDGVFVSNDTYLDRSGQNLLLITGPNMSGKSTYMRQTALIVLMAQAGCFVPCDRARIGICDRIFTRIGASDNLAQGQSTFFVEMSELSYILNSATTKSLVILDEIGRGTSTYDGLSIAWAAAEYLCREDRRIRTLFATHYHEMTALQGVKNYNVDVSEENGEIVFLHKIVEGLASRSYGIHVAKLAGVPQELLQNARERLQQLEESAAAAQATNFSSPTTASEVHDSIQPLVEDSDGDAGKSGSEQQGLQKGVQQGSQQGLQQEMQLSFFDAVPNPVLQKLRSLDLMDTTPSQALRILEELQELLK